MSTVALSVIHLSKICYYDFDGILVMEKMIVSLMYRNFFSFLSYTSYFMGTIPLSVSPVYTS